MCLNGCYWPSFNSDDRAIGRINRRRCRHLYKMAVAVIDCCRAGASAALYLQMSGWSRYSHANGWVLERAEASMWQVDLDQVTWSA